MNTYAVSVLLQKHDAKGMLVTTHTITVRPAASADEAKGLAVAFALESKDGFGVVDLICLDLGEIETKSTAEKIIDDLRRSIDHPVQCPTCKHHFLPYIDPTNLR